MRPYEDEIHKLTAGIEKLVAQSPVPMQKILQKRHVFDTVAHLQRVFSSPEFQQAFDPYRLDVKIRAHIYTIYVFVRDIEAINTIIAQAGGFETYDAMRHQIEALYDAPPHKEPYGAR